jgi:hypothetical protein
MEPSFCPQCGHKSKYNPMAGPATCPKCEYTPPTDARVVAEPRAKPEPPRRPRRSTAQRFRTWSTGQEQVIKRVH